MQGTGDRAAVIHTKNMIEDGSAAIMRSRNGSTPPKTKPVSDSLLPMPPGNMTLVRWDGYKVDL